MTQTLRTQALAALILADPADKVRAVAALPDDQPVGAGPVLAAPCAVPLPGRPPRPLLVSPTDVPRRSMHTTEGKAALIHALAHIEFNAINLALDIIWRFENLPDAFYRDWRVVARDEARHFGLLQAHLGKMGFAYGDFPSHDGLWQMAEKTRDDLLARLALVPRTLEARGLDACPAIRDKLRQSGDPAGADILQIILDDEIGHVAIGNRWYRWCCEKQNRDALQAQQALAAQYGAPRQKGPFNLDARRAAGFTDQELANLGRQ